ncbi:hypothetical protein N836_28720 [Leptolyngbya sp. Heron Island J]|nr:hypothetical protein N836_28720 [Leptolyngbya sp. Heron Island J]
MNKVINNQVGKFRIDLSSNGEAGPEDHRKPISTFNQQLKAWI